jgi:hypothetical protein
VAHFVKPLGASSEGFKQKSDGSLSSMTTGGVGSKKIVVLWGGGNGGEILKLAAIDSKGKRLATTRLMSTPTNKFGVEAGHAKDPDGDDQWFLRYELTIVAEGTGTLTAVDKTGMPFARIALIVPSGDVTEIKQTLATGGISGEETRDSVSPATVLPFTRTPSPTPKGSKLVVPPVTADVHELLFRMEKDGVTFWIGACVPAGTSDFTRAYIFFHPDTMTDPDNATYPAFTGAWPGVRRYVLIQGVQLAAAAKKMVLLVPFMTRASRSNTSATNMFASRGLDTLNSLLDACQTAIGLGSKGAKVARVGVASFSSGIEHMVRFAVKVGGTGIIKEQIDFDSAFITGAKHSSTPRVGGKNIQVTQMSPFDPRLATPRAAANEWLQVDASAWPATSFGPPVIKGAPQGFTIHNNIGNFMFRAMMEKSIV